MTLHQTVDENNKMNQTALALLFCVITAHCATWDGRLRRVVRSPHPPPPPPPPPPPHGEPPVLFHTQNWSGVSRGPNGAHGVFSGAAAAANSPGPVPDEAFSLAAAGSPPVQEKLEERFGGPHFHGYGNNHFSRDFGDFYHGNSGSYKKAFAESEAFANSDDGCDDDSQNGFVGGQQTNSGASSNSQANLNNGASSQSQGGYKSASNQGQSTVSKSFAQSKSEVSVGQQSESLGNGFGKSQNLLNAKNNGGSSSQASQTSGSQHFESNSAGFGSSQGSQNGGGQQVQSHSSGFGSPQGFQNNGGQQVKSHNNGFGISQGLEKGKSQQFQSQSNGFGSSQGFQNGGDQQVQSHNNGFGSSQGFQKGESQQLQSQSNGFGSSQGSQKGENQQLQSQSNGFGSSQGFLNGGGNGGGQQDQSQSSSYVNSQSHSRSNGFGQGSGSNYESNMNKGYGGNGNGFSNGNARSNLNRQDSSSSFMGSNGGRYQYGKAVGSSKYQAGEGGFSSQSSGFDKSLTSQDNEQSGLSSGSGSSGHEDIRSTLDGAAKLVSQGLQASQNAPCSTCQKGSYAFSNARSNSGSAVALSIGG